MKIYGKKSTTTSIELTHVARIVDVNCENFLRMHDVEQVVSGTPAAGSRGASHSDCIHPKTYRARCWRRGSNEADRFEECTRTRICSVLTIDESDRGDFAGDKAWIGAHILEYFLVGDSRDDAIAACGWPLWNNRGKRVHSRGWLAFHDHFYLIVIYYDSEYMERCVLKRVSSKFA